VLRIQIKKIVNSYIMYSKRCGPAAPLFYIAFYDFFSIKLK
jgi:hypothetical protein